MFIVQFCSRRTAYIVRGNAKIFTSVGLSYKDVIFFSKIFYVFEVVYVKSNNIFIVIFWSESRGKAVKRAKRSL